METQQQFIRRFSFEFFPPKTEQGLTKLGQVRDQLATRNPHFFSVTYGAGGSTRERTVTSVLELNRQGIPVAPHISCIGASRNTIAELLDLYKHHNIQRIVALRGDLPSGMGIGAAGEMKHASELVRFIRDYSGDFFSIEVAAYPESHPQSASTQADLAHFKEKIEAGASSAITQYFYSADAYFYFIERCEKAGINTPVVPGVMPITNYSKLMRFSDMCGAEIPRWIRKQLETYGDDIESIGKFGEQVVTKMCENLLSAGAPGLHFYTLNQARPSLAIWDNLGLNEKIAF